MEAVRFLNLSVCF